MATIPNGVVETHPTSPQRRFLTGEKFQTCNTRLRSPGRRPLFPQTVNTKKDSSQLGNRRHGCMNQNHIYGFVRVAKDVFLVWRRTSELVCVCTRCKRWTSLPQSFQGMFCPRGGVVGEGTDGAVPHPSPPGSSSSHLSAPTLLEQQPHDLPASCPPGKPAVQTAAQQAEPLPRCGVTCHLFALSNHTGTRKRYAIGRWAQVDSTRLQILCDSPTSRRS